MNKATQTSKRLGRFIIGLFTKNLLYKLVALLLAVLVWLTVQSLTGKPSRIDGVQLRVYAPENYMLLNDKFQDITLELRGSDEALAQARPHDFKVEYAISPQELQASTDAVHIMLRPQHVVQVPRGITVSDIEPKTVRVSIDHRVTREKEVRVVFTGDLPDGYSATASVIPPMVSVSGPERLLRMTSTIATIPVMLDRSITETFTVNAQPLDIPNPNLSSPVRQVDVTVRVQQTSTQRTFANLPIYLMARNRERKDFELTGTRRVNVRLSGTDMALEAMSPTFLRVFADLSDLGEADSQQVYTVPLRCWCADPKISILSIEPAVTTLKTAPAK